MKYFNNIKQIFIFAILIVGVSAQTKAGTLAVCPQGSEGDHAFRPRDISKCVWVVNDHNKKPSSRSEVDYNIYCPGRMTQKDVNRVGAKIVSGTPIRNQAQHKMNPVVEQHQKAGLVPHYRSVPHRYEYACWLGEKHSVATHFKLRVYATPSGLSGGRNCRYFGSQNGGIAINAVMDREYKCSGLFHNYEKGNTVWQHAKSLVKRDFIKEIKKVNGKACILKTTDIQCDPCTKSDKLIVRVKTVSKASHCPANTYGTVPDSGRVINLGGKKCLDIHAPDIRRNGGKVQMWDCNGQPQQQWTLKGNALKNSAGKCLDIHAPDIRRNGGKVQIWDCNGQPQQQWTLKGNALKNSAGKCLDIHAPDMRRNGGKVQIWDCNRQPQQQWAL